MTRAPVVALVGIVFGVSVSVAGCRDMPTSPASRADGLPDGAPARSLGQAPTRDTVFGPRTFSRQAGNPAVDTVPFAVTDHGVYEVEAVLVAVNGRPDGSRRVAAATVSLDDVPLVGASALAGRQAEIHFPIALPAAGVLTVQLLGPPGGELTLRIEAAYSPGYSKIGPGGGSLVSDDGLATLTLAPGLPDVMLVRLQRVGDDRPTLGTALSGTYEVELWHAAAQTGGPMSIAADGGPEDQFFRMTDAVLDLSIETPDVDGTALVLGAVGGSTEPTIAQSSRVGPSTVRAEFIAIAASSEGMATGLAESGAVFARVSPRGLVMRFRAVLGPFMDDCSDQYAIIPNVPTSRTPIIFVHGLQLERYNCFTWKWFDPVIGPFDPFAVGTALEGHLRDLRADVWFYRFTYPTYNSVDIAAASLAAELESLVGSGKKAILVGHSMGGLVARRAVEAHGAAPYVRRIITLGTPHLGTPLAQVATDLAAVAAALDLVCKGLITCDPLVQFVAFLLNSFLGTDGVLDLRPNPGGNLEDIRPEIGYHFFGGSWLPVVPADCGGYGFELCGPAWLFHLLMSEGNDGLVPRTSAFLGNNVPEAAEPSYGLLYHHFGLHQGMPRDSSPDAVLTRVVDIIAEAIATSPATATINVTSNLSTTWTIEPGSITGSGTADTHTVTPSTVGTLYTITAQAMTGLTQTIATSDGPGAALVLTAGQAKTFMITYTPDGGEGFQIQSISAGDGYSCALTTAGKAYCWGLNDVGQLGDGTTVNRDTPVRVVGDLTFVSLDAGGTKTCGLTEAGRVYCWGWRGQLGDGTWMAEYQEAVPEPVEVLGGHVFTSLAGTGAVHTCAITNTGAAYCWGFNRDGAIGDGTKGPWADSSSARLVPTLVSGNHTWRAIDTGWKHTCGITTSGAAYCWGANTGPGVAGGGQLGDGTTDERLVPTAVVGGLTFKSIAVSDHSCAITPTGTAHCWGPQWIYSALAPFEVDGGLVFDRITAGGAFRCGVTTARTAYCWGHDWGGNTGGPEWSYTVPQPVVGGLTFASVSAGGTHACGVTTAGTAYCWGIDEFGQLGGGGGWPQDYLVRVVKP
jgi:alpha-tubulin suppressor-like RCC1 family protein/pimeloyl-ACP methyl ester carboxylesterase